MPSIAALLLLTNWNALHEEFGHIVLSNTETGDGGCVGQRLLSIIVKTRILFIFSVKSFSYSSIFVTRKSCICEKFGVEMKFTCTTHSQWVKKLFQADTLHRSYNWKLKTLSDVKWRSGGKSNTRKKGFPSSPTGVEPMTFQNTGWNALTAELTAESYFSLAVSRTCVTHKNPVYDLALTMSPL